MTSFGWKRKIGAKVSPVVVKQFESNSKDDIEDEINNDEIDWLTLAPKRKAVCLEDAKTKSDRLKKEGTVLAESERYWEAIKKWDEAIQLMPLDEKLYEMKAQALLILCEVYPALKMATKAVECNPSWWVGHQTLGRAHLGLGEVKMAVKSFSRAVHLNPGNLELWQEDLLWAKSLLMQRKGIENEKENSEESSKLKITELDENCKTVHHDNSNTDISQETASKEMNPVNQLPANYVKMRDA